ncbi:MAG: molybdopterin-synthase adenylyltransferase MoeB [Nitrososphaerota archaeon]|nr:molybdopterin-synthase adenylyltransferase MoeB [Nitrososphaerota archaeon]
MVKVLIPTALKQYTEGSKTQINVKASTVAEALAGILKENQRLAKHIVDEEGNLRNFVNIFLNSEDIRHLNGQQTKVSDSDTLRIVPAIAGGSQVTERRTSVPNFEERKVMISPKEYRRYGRHLIIPEVGMEGQRKLKAAKVLVIGTGGLGAPSSLYLAAAGVGTIGLIDFDVVDETNLHRQILYTDKDVGKSKVETAKRRLLEANPNTIVKTYEEPLSSENALEIFKGYDVIVDGTDNFPTRYLTNDACVMLGKPNVYASIFRFEGQASVFDPKKGPCYRCLYPKPPPPGLVPSCAEGGVLGVLPGLVGLIQATEAIKLILGTGEPLIGRLLLYDALSMTFEELKIKKNPNCVVCSDHPEITKLIDYQAFCGVEAKPDVASVMPKELSAELSEGKKIMLLDVREPHEFEIVHIGGAKLIPLSELPNRVSELDSADEIVAYCHTGMRSARATDFLRGIGYKKVRNLEGGVEAWSTEVDPSLPRY